MLLLVSTEINPDPLKSIESALTLLEILSDLLLLLNTRLPDDSRPNELYVILLKMISLLLLEISTLSVASVVASISVKVFPEIPRIFELVP